MVYPINKQFTPWRRHGNVRLLSVLPNLWILPEIPGQMLLWGGQRTVKSQWLHGTHNFHQTMTYTVKIYNLCYIFGWDHALRTSHVTNSDRPEERVPSPSFSMSSYSPAVVRRPHLETTLRQGRSARRQSGSESSHSYWAGYQGYYRRHWLQHRLYTYCTHCTLNQLHRQYTVCKPSVFHTAKLNRFDALTQTSRPTENLSVYRL